MKRTGWFAVCLLCITGTLMGEVTRVRVQINGCLRSTCSRKVAQALHKGKIGIAAVGELQVDDAMAGLASFSLHGKPLDLRRMHEGLNRAGYGLKMVLLESDVPGANGPAGETDLGNLAVTLSEGCPASYPIQWHGARERARGYLWVPDGAEGKTGKDGRVAVCAVP